MVQDLKITVTTNADAAVSSLDRLVSKIDSLKAATEKSLGFERISNDIEKFTTRIANIQTDRFKAKMEELTAIINNFSLNTSKVFNFDTSGLQRIESILSRINEYSAEMQNKANNFNINIKETASQTHKMSSGFKEASKSAKSINLFSVGILGKIISIAKQIKRITFYRIVRGAFKAITNGIGEGIQNLAHFSSLFQGTMNGYTTQMGYLKNSFAAMFQPLLTSALPIFQKITDAIGGVIEKLAMFFSYMAGKTTYTKATHALVQYGDAAEETSKKVKRSILGFDEINALTSNESSSSDTTDYSKMFEEVTIPEATQKKLQKIKDVFLKAWEIAKDIASIVKNVVDAISPVISTFIEEAYPYIKDALSTIKNVTNSMKSWSIPAKTAATLGLLASILAFGVKGTIAIALDAAIIWNTGKKIGQGTADFKDWIANILGVIGAGVIGGITFGATGFVVGLTLGLALDIVSISLGRRQASLENNKEYQRLIKSISETEEITKEVKVNIDLRSESLGELQSKYNVAKDLIEKIYNLVDNKGDITTIQAYVDTLNNLGFGELISSFDPLTGKIKETKEEIEGLLDSMYRLSVQQYAGEQLGQVLVDRYSLQKQYNKANADVLEIEAKFYKAWANNLDSVDGISTFKLLRMYGDATKAKEEIEKQLAEANSEVELFSSLASGNFKTLSGGIMYTFSEIEEKAKSTGLTIKDESGKIVGTVQGDADNLTDYINTLAPTLGIEVTDTSTIVQGDLSTIQTLLNNSQLELDIGVKYDFPEQDVDLGWTNIHVDGGNVIGKYDGTLWQKSYATGGFPEDGLFFANHNELVGQFSNGKTAVANNEQITEGIATAVYNAIVSANSNGSNGDITIPIYIDGQLSETKIIRANERANKRAGRTILAVGG